MRPPPAQQGVALEVNQVGRIDAAAAQVKRGIQPPAFRESGLVGSAEQGSTRSVVGALLHGTGRGGRTRPGLARVGHKLRAGEAAGQLVADIGVERVQADSLPLRGLPFAVEGEHVATQGALLPVAVEGLAGVGGAQVAGSGTRFHGSRGAAQPEAARRETCRNGGFISGRAAARQEHGPAGAGPVHAGGRAFYHFQPAQQAGVE